jgi:uncharacterized membrane protein
MVVHAVGVGASLRSVVSYRDLQMTGMECPERLLLNNMVKIKAAVEGIGLTGRVVSVTLEEDEKQVADQELTIDDVEGAQEVVFDFRPTNKGRHTYTVKVAPQADEKIVENNQRSTVAVVVEPGIRVLYLEGTTRDEYGAIVEQFLAKDPDLEFLALRQTRPNVFVRRTNIADLQVTTIPTDAETINKFDVFIIGDLDSTYLKPNVQQLIIARAKQNGGLVMLGGGHSLGPGGYEGTPIGDALPVRLGGRDAGQVSDNFLPTLTPDGANHPIFANIAEYFPTQQQPKPKSGDLPPLPGCTRLGAAKPATTVLALHPAEGGMPVLAVQPLEKGRTAVFAGDKTVNWHKVSRFLDQQSPFTRFWGQLVRWLAGRTTAVETGAGVVAETDKAHYEPEEPVKIAAVVRNQDGQGAADAQVTANVVAPSGRPDQITMKAVAGPAGHYGGDFVPPLAGQYKIVVEAKVGGQVIQSDKLLIDVGRPNLEFEKLDLDEKLLSQIAADAHGRYLHLTAADHLVEQLDRSARKKREYYTKELYFPPLFWTLFVAVISLEWVLRKRFQLR